MCTKDFIRDVFTGKKKLKKIGEVKFIQVPRYDELSVRKLYAKLMGLEGMADYFPSTYPKGRVCDREYLFNIAATLHEDTMNELISHAHSQRHSISGE